MERYALDQNFSISAILTIGLSKFLWGSLVHYYIMFSNNVDLSSLDASSTLGVMSVEHITSDTQMSTEGKIALG